MTGTGFLLDLVWPDPAEVVAFVLSCVVLWLEPCCSSSPLAESSLKVFAFALASYEAFNSAKEVVEDVLGEESEKVDSVKATVDVITIVSFVMEIIAFALWMFFPTEIDGPCSEFLEAMIQILSIIKVVFEAIVLVKRCNSFGKVVSSLAVTAAAHYFESQLNMSVTILDAAITIGAVTTTNTAGTADADISPVDSMGSTCSDDATASVSHQEPSLVADVDAGDDVPAPLLPMAQQPHSTTPLPTYTTRRGRTVRPPKRYVPGGVPRAVLSRINGCHGDPGNPAQRRD